MGSRTMKYCSSKKQQTANMHKNLNKSQKYCDKQKKLNGDIYTMLENQQN